MRDALVALAQSGQARGWSMHLLPANPRSLASLRDLRPAGVFGSFENLDLPVSIGSRIPAVDLSLGRSRGKRLARVTIDHRRSGRLAAEHLLERSWRRLAVIAKHDSPYAALRAEGFRAVLGEAGLDADVFWAPASRNHSWPVDSILVEDRLRRWLLRRGPPLACFAAKDLSANQVLRVAQDLGWQVPHDLAVVGIGDDRVHGAFAVPPVTSVRYPGAELGRRAVAVMADLLDGQAPRHEVIAPVDVVVRESSDLDRVDDLLVQHALDLIRQRGTTGLGVSGLARGLGVERRTLERRFTAALGHGPGWFLRRHRLSRAQRALLDGESSIAEVARACGFANATRLGEAFTRAFGVSPGTFRTRR